MTIKSDHDLIQQVLDGSISHEGFKAFQIRLRGEPGLIALYRQYALLHHSLCEEFEGQLVVRKPLTLCLSKTPAILMFAAAAAAAVVFGVLLILQSKAPSRPMVIAAAPQSATVTFSEDAIWSIRGEQHAVGQVVTLSSGAIIRLQQGQARLALATGATAVIDGNAVLEFVSNEALRLGHGRGRFRLDAQGKKLEVATATMTAVDLGTEFGLLSLPGQPEEVHVFEGRVQLRLPLTTESPVLAAGEAVRVMENSRLERISLRMPRVARASPQFERILADRFNQDGEPATGLERRGPRYGQGLWKVSRGSPKIAAGRLEGRNFEAFFKLPKKCLSKERPILLATLETTEALGERLHAPGWAGMSFCQNGVELLFFGDGFGDESTWSINVRRKQPIALPQVPVLGPRTVTLCYNRNTGAASLHMGALPLGPAFVSGTLPKGLEFDEIRIGASKEAPLALRSLTVRTGEAVEEAR